MSKGVKGIIPIRRVEGKSLRIGTTKSCWCLQRDVATKHGHTKGGQRTVEYRTWASMKRRCINPRSTNYPGYGGRGIQVCDQWMNSFECFLSNMGIRPSKGHSIDRINNEGNYEPGNCRWATASEQQRNKRRKHTTPTSSGSPASLLRAVTEAERKQGELF